MLKQKFILTILLVAFGLVLTHSIVPHHHHQTVAEATNHTHDNPLEQSLEWYKHAGNTGDYFLGSSHQFCFDVIECQELFSFDFNPKGIVEESSPLCVISQNTFFLPQIPISSLSFRGPPQA